MNDNPGSPLLLITSHDVMVETDTVRRLIQAAEAHPDAGILGANVGGADKVSLGSDGDVNWVHWTSGTCLLLRRACLEHIGGFDERFHSYGEDVDLGFRATDAGWRVGKVGSAKAAERGSSAGSAHALRQMRANALLLAYKRSGWPGLARKLAEHCVRVLKILGLAVRSPRRLSWHLRLALNHLAALGIAGRRLPKFIPRHRQSSPASRRCHR